MLGGICVSKQKRLKKQLGSGYQFEQRFPAKNLARMLQRLEGSNHFRVAAILSAGAVRLEAVVYWDNGKYSLGYDLLVKDTPFSPDCLSVLQHGVSGGGAAYARHGCRYHPGAGRTFSQETIGDSTKA